MADKYLLHRRGGLNPPDNTPKGVSVYVFGQIQSAPTVHKCTNGMKNYSMAVSLSN